MLIKLGAIFAILAIIGGAVFLWKPWQKVTLPFSNSQSQPKISIVKPKPDLGRARQLVIDPTKDSVMQVRTHENVIVTLEVPKNALKEKTTVKLIPFYHDKDKEAPTQGVIVSPASLSFSEPVTLSFNFSESSVKNNAPKSIKTLSIRTSGLSQVMQIDSNATSLTPVLVARGIETEKYLPARILTGGAYVFSTDGNLKNEVSKKALNTKKMNSLTIIESATALLFNNQKLSNEELSLAKKAVAKVLSQKNPPPLELFAALVLQKKIKDNTFAWIPEALAYETAEGFYQVACKTEGLSVEQYLGYAQSAQLLGHEGIGESCMNKAKNAVAEQANKVLANPESDIKSLLIALQDVQILGMDDETNLDEQLMEKAKEKVVEEGKKVADNPNSSPNDAAIALQKMQALDVEGGATYDSLSQKVTEAVEEYEEPKEDPLDVEATIDEEEVLNNAAMSALGIAMLQAFGFEQLDEESIKQKVDELSEGTKALHQAAYAMCAEFGDEECMSKLNEIEPQIAEAEREGYRVAEEIGAVQSREYEEPEYLEENGDVSLYFEPSPTPGNEEEEYYEDYQEETEEAGYDLYESGENYEQEEEGDYSQYSEEEYDGSYDSYEYDYDYGSESEDY